MPAVSQDREATPDLSQHAVPFLRLHREGQHAPANHCGVLHQPWHKGGLNPRSKRFRADWTAAHRKNAAFAAGLHFWKKVPPAQAQPAQAALLSIAKFNFLHCRTAFRSRQKCSDAGRQRNGVGAFFCQQGSVALRYPPGLPPFWPLLLRQYFSRLHPQRRKPLQEMRPSCIARPLCVRKARRVPVRALQARTQPQKPKTVFPPQAVLKHPLPGFLLL